MAKDWCRGLIENTQGFKMSEILELQSLGGRIGKTGWDYHHPIFNTNRFYVYMEDHQTEMQLKFPEIQVNPKYIEIAITHEAVHALNKNAANRGFFPFDK